MKRSIKGFVAFGSIALVALVVMVASAAAADGTYTANFESPTFSTTVGPPTAPAGSVDGQDGWHSAVPGDIPALPNGYDQAIVDNSLYPNAVANAGAFGAQSLRVSNAVSEKTAEFLYQTYSAPTPNPAGETTGNKVFDATFKFIPTTDQFQSGLRVDISPDNGTGGRMSFVSLTDTTDGIFIRFFQTVAGGGFVAHDVGTYDRDQIHTIRFLIEFVPGQNADGTGNDVLRLFVDGVDIGERDGVCFTTWETFYRATSQVVPVTDSLEFRADNTAGDNDCNLNGASLVDLGGGLATCVVANLAGGGYLFDDVATATRNADGPAPTTCGLADDGVIAPTGTTCSQYRDGTASDLGQLQYTTKGSNINAVSPGVFFYYTKVSGDQGDDVNITQDDSATPDLTIPIQNGQVVLYDASTCKVLKWTVTSNGEATGTLPSDGDFIIGVKYSASSLKGQATPNPTTVTYSFGTELNDVPFQVESTIDLVPKA